MAYRIEFRPAAHRDLLKLEPFIRRKVLADVEKLADNPRPHGVEKLEAKDKLYRNKILGGTIWRQSLFSAGSGSALKDGSGVRPD